ncbi:hypothetical protein EDC04DRAFT_2629746, partial [Pisolithus marmoratus]
ICVLQHQIRRSVLFLVQAILLSMPHVSGSPISLAHGRHVCLSEGWWVIRIFTRNTFIFDVYYSSLRFCVG